MHVGPYLGLGEPFNITRVMFEMPALVLDIGASTEIEVSIFSVSCPFWLHIFHKHVYPSASIQTHDCM